MIIWVHTIWVIWYQKWRILEIHPTHGSGIFLDLAKNGIPCENRTKKHSFDIRSLERDENSEPRPRNIFASLAHNAKFYPRFRIFDGQKFSFKLMSDQQGLKGGDINTAFKRGNLPFMEISNNFHKKYLTRFFSILRVNFETKFIYGP